MLDADKIPSDQPFSTHAISSLGMDLLDELGVGEKIRRVAPIVQRGRIAVGSAVVDMPLPESRAMYCPRRSVLDPLLSEAATSAGAVLHDETAVLDVIREGERVVGVRARHGSGTREIRARVVVGADGRNSTIAKRVGAGEYHAADGERGGYWTYFRSRRNSAICRFRPASRSTARAPASRSGRTRTSSSRARWIARAWQGDGRRTPGRTSWRRSRARAPCVTWSRTTRPRLDGSGS